MTVYVDLLFGLNALINYLLLRGSAAMSGCPVKLWRLGAAAVFGGLYAVAAVLPGMEHLQALWIQAASAGLMLVAAFGWKRNTIKQGLFFFGLSFAFGGIVLMTVQLVEPDFLLLGGRAYYAVSTPALLLLAGLSYALAALALSGCGQHTGGDIVPLQLTLAGKTLQIRALRDTGNTLRDPVTGQAVLVLGKGVFRSLLPAGDAGALEDPAALLPELGWQYPDLRFRLIPYRAVGVKTGLLLAVRCGLEWKQRHQTVLVAFSPTEISEDGRFDALWGGEIL